MLGAGPKVIVGMINGAGPKLGTLIVMDIGGMTMLGKFIGTISKQGNIICGSSMGDCGTIWGIVMLGNAGTCGIGSVNGTSVGVSGTLVKVLAFGVCTTVHVGLTTVTTGSMVAPAA